MNITINEKILKNYNLSLNEFLILYICSQEINIQSTIQQLIAKGFVDKDLKNLNSAVVSDNIKEIISSILVDSDKAVIDKDEEFLQVAKEMMAIYPKGMKPGTNYLWKDSVGIIAKKLKTLVIKFNFKFTKDQAIEATKKYVEGFNGNYKFMQLLKYFILKTDKLTGETRSDFMSYIENDSEININNDDWLNEIK